MNLQRRIKIKPLSKNENKGFAKKLNTRGGTFLALQKQQWSEFTHSNECKTALMRKRMKCLPELDQYHDMNLSSGRNRYAGIIYPSMSVNSPQTWRPEYKKSERKAPLWGLVVSHDSIQPKFSKKLKISDREIKSFPMLLFNHLGSTKLKQESTCVQLAGCTSSHIPSHELHLSLSQYLKILS